MLIQYHKSITRAALGDLFRPPALKAILAANLKQDNLLTGQIGHHEYHYDHNALVESERYLEKQRALALLSMQNNDLPAAWAAFGRLVHAAQDFYAHTNYVDLWLSRFGDHGQTPPPPAEIDPVMEDLIRSPSLRSGKLYHPWEVLSFIPGIKNLVIPLLPADSHARMHLDSPARGERFRYAFEAAVLRTRYEYNQTAARLPDGDDAQFRGLVVVQGKR